MRLRFRAFPARPAVLAFLSGACALTAWFPVKARAGDVEFVYGVRTGCGVRPEDVVRDFVDGVRELTRICDAHNATMKAGGGRACPPSTCLGEYRPGDTRPPELTIGVEATDRLGSEITGVSSDDWVRSGANTPGQISGGIRMTRSNSSNDGLVVKIGLTLWLGRDPDVLTCLNPMSQVARDALLTRITELSTRAGGSCASDL